MQKKVSIKDIAQVVGVSTATVSLVLSNKYQDGRVGKEMANKIIEVAAKMQYQPNLVAKSLKSGSSNTIGLLIADIVNPFFSQLAYHIQKEMQMYGYAVIIVNTDEKSEHMGEMISLLKSRQVDGFIIVPTEGGGDLISTLKNNQTPLVLLDRSYPEIDTCNVLVDNFSASYQATSYLISKGYKKIGFITYNSDMIHIKERERGYQEAMLKLRINSDKWVQRVNSDNLLVDIQAIVQAMQSEKEKFDAVVFATNTLSFAGVKAMMKVGMKIGMEIEIVCFDKSDWFDFFPASILYIQQPIADLGIMAAKLLMEQITLKDTDVNLKTHLLPYKFEV